MYTEPMKTAARSEVKAPMYIDLQSVLRADGPVASKPWLCLHLVDLRLRLLRCPLVSTR